MGVPHLQVMGVPGPCVVQFSMSAAETFPNDPPVCCNCNCNCKDRHSAPHSTHTQVPCCHSPVYIHTYTDSIAWCSRMVLTHYLARVGVSGHFCCTLRLPGVPAGTPRALHGVAYGAGSDTQHDREMWLVQLPSTPNNPGPGARPAALPSVTSSVEYSPVCAPCRTLGMELGMLPLSALPAIST